jgi:hypothetical protein
MRVTFPIPIRSACIAQVGMAMLFFISGRVMPEQHPEHGLEEDRVAIGYVVDGFLFASFLPRVDEKDFKDHLRNGGSMDEIYDWTGYEIFKSPLFPSRLQASVRYQIGPCVPRAEGIPHWRISHGCFWGGSVDKIELDKLDSYNPENTSPAANARRNDAGLALPGAIGFNPELLVRDEYRRKNGLHGLVSYEGIYSDTLPAGKDSLKSLILLDGHIRTWKGKYITDKKGKWHTEWNPSVIEEIDAGFSEPFYVWAKGADLFFVTKSGKLYYSKKPASGQRKATALWSDGSPRRSAVLDPDSGSIQYPDRDKNPIRGLIFDADSNKGFAFTRPKAEDKDQHPMYFELAAPLTPRPYPGFKLDKPPDNYTLRTLMEYAQFLIAKKEIKIKP